jgi:hypothetical protein
MALRSFSSSAFKLSRYLRSILLCGIRVLRWPSGDGPDALSAAKSGLE